MVTMINHTDESKAGEYLPVDIVFTVDIAVVSRPLLDHRTLNCLQLCTEPKWFLIQA